MISSIFSRVEMAPRDPILGVNEAFSADPRPVKVNLGVGVYFDDNGRIPLLNAVRLAEKTRLEIMPPRPYQPIDGSAIYNQAVQCLLFGEGSELRSSGRVATITALGGTSALRIGADFLRRLQPDAAVYISDPSWENHRALFQAAGFLVDSYPYYDAESRGVDFCAMKAKLASVGEGSIVVLHACCHNPTGADLVKAQWEELIDLMRARNLIAFIDMAYQGFGEGIADDALALNLFAASGLPFFVASSFSKSFSLYGERVGALSVITANADEAARVLSQVKRVVRTNYSNPPIHGAAVVAAVLGNPMLRTMWEAELAGMRNRIRNMRLGLVDRLATRGVSRDFSFVARQRGMFSYTGLSSEQVEVLREEFGIYAVSTGRVCLAALNSKNIDYVADAIAAVL